MPTTVPPSLYAHPDPLISRLRLNDSHGKPILDPAASTSELRDATVVAFLFGAQVDRENQEYGRNLYKVRDEHGRRPTGDGGGGFQAPPAAKASATGLTAFRFHTQTSNATHRA